MSLEEKLAKLTEAVESLTEAFIAHTNDAAPAKAASKKVTAKNVAEHLEGEEAPKEAKATTKVATTVVAERQQKAAAEAAKKPAPAAKAEDGIDPSYAPVKAAILDAVEKGHRDDVTALFKEYGVKNGQGLKPETYDEFLGRVDEIVNGGLA